MTAKERKELDAYAKKKKLGTSSWARDVLLKIARGDRD